MIIAGVGVFTSYSLIERAKEHLDDLKMTINAQRVEILDLRERLFHRLNAPNPASPEFKQQKAEQEERFNKSPARNIVSPSQVVRDLVREDIEGKPPAARATRIPPTIREGFLKDVGVAGKELTNNVRT